LANEWQPIPKIVDTEYAKTAEKINEDVEENKLKITLTNSKNLQKSGASYVKYKLRYGEEQKDTGHIDVSKNS
jgi:hypothetical protein